MGRKAQNRQTRLEISRKTGLWIDEEKVKRLESGQNSQKQINKSTAAKKKWGTKRLKSLTMRGEKPKLVAREPNGAELPKQGFNG